MQRLEKRNQRRRLRRIQIVPVGRHVATSLQHLADQLISRQSRRHGIEFGTALAATAAKRMAVATLFGLENDRAFAFQRCPGLQKLFRHGLAAPRGHLRAPRAIFRKMRERAERHGDERDRHNGKWGVASSFFPLLPREMEEAGARRSRRPIRPESPRSLTKAAAAPAPRTATGKSNPAWAPSG